MSTGLATIKNGEALDAEIVQAAPIIEPSALAPIIRAEIDAAILLAKQYPRSITNFLDRALSLATRNYTAASKCCYAMPRDGKDVEGPSVRLAEIVAATYGNLRVDGRIIEERERFVVAQGVAQDLENNTTWRSEVRRGVWSKGNPRKNIPPGRYSDDMVNVTCNAAISIACRNVIFRVVPRAIYWDIYEECKAIRDKGDKSRTLAAQRADWLNFLVKEQGFKEGEVLAVLGVAGVDDIGVRELSRLAGFQTAVQDGEATWESILRPDRFALEDNASPGVPQASKADRLAETLERKAAEKGKARRDEKLQAQPAAPDDAWPAGRE